MDKKTGQELYLELRGKHPVFRYDGYKLLERDGKLSVEYCFAIPGLAEFKPRWEFKRPERISARMDDERLDRLVFSLGMVELVSYWKLMCAPRVEVLCGSLTGEQAQWWKKLYAKGLGEFFYLNGITTEDDFVEIVSCGGLGCGGEGYGGEGCEGEGSAFCGAGKTEAGEFGDSFDDSFNDNRVIIPLGGGKDSAVTLELLKKYAERFCYVINPNESMLGTAEAGGVPEANVLTARRTLDKNMLELNKQGYLNGHTPFSAIVAFSSVLVAYLYGIKYVALSNEASASEPTVLGSDVNHQYSKSLEFESDFVEFETRHISSGVKYFSLLRPLAELGVAKIFSKLEQYHQVFRSCNKGSREGIWCCSCPKCLFVYIILAPFLTEEKMVGIFGKNMLGDAALIPTFDKLVGLHIEKPFECVGSRDEVNAALQELVSQRKREGTPLPELLRYYVGRKIEKRHDFDAICNGFSENNLVPDKFIQAVKDRINC